MILALLLGLLAWSRIGNRYPGVVVGTAMALNSPFAPCAVGVLPLFLKRLRLDRALMAGPLLMTLADAFGFFLTLGLAGLAVQRLAA